MEGNMRVPGSLPFQGRIVHQQTVHRAGGDAEIKARPAELEEVRIPLPVRPPDHSDLVALGVEHTRDNSGRRKRVVDIGLTAHEDDVEITTGCGDHAVTSLSIFRLAEAIRAESGIGDEQSPRYQERIDKART